MGADADPFGAERGERDGAHGDQGRRDAAAEVTAATPVLVSVIFDMGSVIGVGGAGEAVALRIICTARILVGDQDREGRTGRLAVEDAADDAEGVRLAPGCVGQTLRPAFGKLGRDKGLVDGDAGREPVQDGADLGTVRLSEKGQDDGSA